MLTICTYSDNITLQGITKSFQKPLQDFSNVMDRE